VSACACCAWILMLRRRADPFHDNLERFTASEVSVKTEQIESSRRNLNTYFLFRHNIYYVCHMSLQCEYANHFTRLDFFWISSEAS
jgi:hypothetical protein